ncbi:hypothetical protein Pint_16558 [Pistacia integerrima]|uniref:Uncharacterized protein n=1 Tax=Pistacia integerrima TaxID=434235 RepID=A0ACC0ZFV8_9ROSI|nr:hypothetical protein Pint_16558 [Pistacia integerrima]
MGGVVHTIVGPIEGTKPLLQTQDNSLAIVGSGRRKSKGMLDCIVRIVQEEGLLSLWGGNGSSVLRYYPSVALSFSLKLGQGKAIEDPHADCYKDGEDQSDMVKIHEDQKFEVLILNTFV